MHIPTNHAAIDVIRARAPIKNTQCESDRIHFWRAMLLFYVLLGTSCRSQSPTQPALSTAIFTPNGKSIVFTALRGYNCFIYQANLLTGLAYRVTNTGAGCETDPAFSSDGKSIAFMKSPQAGARAALILARPDGSEARTLVSNVEDNLAPVFVPNSTKIFFLRSAAFEHHSPLVDNRRHKFDLFSVDIESRSVTAVTHSKFYGLDKVSVSKDGEWVLYSVFTGEYVFQVASAANPGQFTLALHPVVDGANVLTPMSGATWLPDGKAFVFKAASSRGGQSTFDFNLYRLTVETGAIKKLTNFSGPIDGFSLSPDGTKAVLLKNHSYYLVDLWNSTVSVIPIRPAV